MAVDQHLGVSSQQPGACACCIHVGIDHAGLFASFALHSQRCGNRLALRQRPGQKILLPFRAANFFAKVHVIDVSKAQSVAMRQQPALLVKCKRCRVLQQGRFTLCHHVLADQEIAVAMHEKDRQPLASLRQHFPASVLKAWMRAAHGIVANPNLKQVTENKHRVRWRRLHVVLPQLESGGLTRM